MMAFQRMVIAPGCYVLAAGQSYDASAYCLDQFRTVPPSGAILAYAPAALGDAAVKVGAEAPIPLPAALAKRLIQLEGLGDARHVRIRNLTQGRVAICVRSPTIIMGNGEDDTGDLPKLYGRISRILARPDGNPHRTASEASTADQSAHDRRQQNLWNYIDDINRKAASQADEAEYEELSHRLFFGPILPPKGALPPIAVPGVSKCSDRTDSVVVCLTR